MVARVASAPGLLGQRSRLRSARMNERRNNIVNNYNEKRRETDGEHTRSRGLIPTPVRGETMTAWFAVVVFAKRSRSRTMARVRKPADYRASRERAQRLKNIKAN